MITDSHDRFTKRNDDDQAMPFGEMSRGGQPPAREARQNSSDVIGYQRQHPKTGLHPPLEL
jgi:hypothetical protein